MKLSDEQIQSLYRFTREHFVEHYDLQTELVDHLSNAIEEEWKENPKLSFEEALQKEFKKFGIFGFMDVVESRRSALSKKYNQVVWQHFKEFFSFPKIMLTLATIVGLIFLFKQISFVQEILVASALAMTVCMIVKIQSNKRKFGASQKSDKKWLFEEIVFHYGDWLFFFTLPMQLLLHVPEAFFQTNLGISIGVTMVSLFFLLGYVMVFVIPNLSEKYLEETYPEYKIAK
ncbi:hypothetical protein GV828_11395 [Flavobacterium sp. NST-5]|uniref:Uncharacterized protein n=1 Tax=Flavobacterium ichthyis TaxID=2698827 RepID=A0ABW9ZFE1_9FLAO|nr:hypothetical protein [Flavobacterium ichthyis]NBL65805.1 hypothetical protein [Flavobacterium ichthyis]